VFTFCVVYNVAACGRSGGYGVAACLACVAAAAVDRQAQQSCRVWYGGVNWVLCSRHAAESNAGHDSDSWCRHRLTTGCNRTNYPLLRIEVRPTALPSLLRLSTIFDRQLLPPFLVPSEL